MPMKLFRPTTVLDKFYELGILIKGIDGAVELIGGLLVLLVPRSTILHLTTTLTHSELANDPHDFLANHLVHAGHQLATGSHVFAAAFLLTHGIVKVGLVTALLLQKLWAYPWALVVLTLFLGYQAYLLMVRPTFGMWFLTILDVVIIWLIWREWRRVQSSQKSKSDSSESV